MIVVCEMANTNDLEPHQIYLLQVMALPADVQMNEYLWDDDEVPLGIADSWMICFTGAYRSGMSDDPLPNLAADLIEINEKRHAAAIGSDDTIWTNDGLVNHPFWAEIRKMARTALDRRGIAPEKPDPDGWYFVLPEELH